MRSLGIAGLLLAATCGCSGSTVAPTDLSTDGPLRVPPEHGTFATGPVGTTFTDGLDVLFLAGSRPATVVSVRSVGADTSLRFIGAMIAGPTRSQAGWSQLKGYPPRLAALGPLVDAEGAVIDPREETRQRLGYELLLGYEVVDDTTVDHRSAIEVTYEVDGKQYLWRSPARLVYCPPDKTNEECNEIAEADESGQ